MLILVLNLDDHPSTYNISTEVGFTIDRIFQLFALFILPVDIPTGVTIIGAEVED